MIPKAYMPGTYSGKGRILSWVGYDKPPINWRKYRRKLVLLLCHGIWYSEGIFAVISWSTVANRRPSWSGNTNGNMKGSHGSFLKLSLSAICAVRRFWTSLLHAHTYTHPHPFKQRFDGNYHDASLAIVLYMYVIQYRLHSNKLSPIKSKVIK